MFTKALLFIAAAVHFAKLSPKGNFFLIETQDRTEDEGKYEDSMENDDYAKTEEGTQKPTMTKEENIPSCTYMVDVVCKVAPCHCV